MLHHNLTIAIRNLLKYKLQTSISILSLTVGMVCFALSALWLRYENSYDTWWPEHDDVYMVQYSGDSGYYMEVDSSTTCHIPTGSALRKCIRMFLKEYIYLLLASAVIAFPVGYYLMHLWLMQYAKQAPIYWWISPSIILAMFTLIYLTIIWQISKAASEPPANVVKSE